MRVCVCTNESVSCCGNGLGWMCFQRENLTTAFYRVGWWEISAVVHHGAIKFFFFFVSSLKELNFLKLRDFSVGILSILICIFSDILWPVLCGSQPLQEAAHLHGEDHWFVQGQETTRSASARLRHHRFGLQVHVARYVVVVVVVGSFIFWLSLGRQGKKRENIKTALPFACSFWGNVKPGHIWWRWSPG